MEGTQNTDRWHDFLQAEAYGWRKVGRWRVQNQPFAPNAVRSQSYKYVLLRWQDAVAEGP